MKLAASVVAALFAALGCTTTAKKSAERDAREPGRTEETVASSPAAQSAARGAEKPVEKRREPQREGRGMTAVEHASETGKYLFVFFRTDDDEQTRKMRGVFDGAMKRVADRAESVVIDVSDPSEKGIVKKFGVDRAPMPLVLVLAPNGAVTGGFPVRFEEKQLTEAFAGPSTEKVLKALQGGKLVFVCAQNARTGSNAPAMRGVKDFAADTRYAKDTEIVTLDPTDAAEAKFLAQIKIDPEAKEATTVFLAPPGMVVGKFVGATDKDALVAALESCGAGCGPTGST